MIKISYFFILFSMLSCITKQKNYDGMTFIKGGTFQMGADNAQARFDEFPKHTVTVSDFWVDNTSVSYA